MWNACLYVVCMLCLYVVSLLWLEWFLWKYIFCGSGCRGTWNQQGWTYSGAMCTGLFLLMSQTWMVGTDITLVWPIAVALISIIHGCAVLQRRLFLPLGERVWNYTCYLCLSQRSEQMRCLDSCSQKNLAVKPNVHTCYCQFTSFGIQLLADPKMSKILKPQWV